MKSALSNRWSAGQRTFVSSRHLNSMIPCTVSDAAVIDVDEKLKKDISEEVAKTRSSDRDGPIRAIRIIPGGKSLGIASSLHHQKEAHGLYPKLAVESPASFLLAVQALAQMSTRISENENHDENKSFSAGFMLSIKSQTWTEIVKSGISRSVPLFMLVTEAVKEAEKADKEEVQDQDPPTRFKVSKTTSWEKLSFNFSQSIRDRGFAEVSFVGGRAAEPLLKGLLATRQELLRTSKGHKTLLVKNIRVSSASNNNEDGAVQDSDRYQVVMMKLEAVDCEPTKKNEPPKKNEPTQETSQASSSPPPLSILPTASLPSKVRVPSMVVRVPSDTISISRKDWEALHTKLSLLNKQNIDLIQMVAELTKKL